MILNSEYNDLYQKHEEVYQKLKNEGHKGWGASNFDDRMEGWKKNISMVMEFLEGKKGRLLELGCGNGEVTRMFAMLGFEAYGVDISDTATQWAKELSKLTSTKIDFRTGDVCNIDKIYDIKFEVIVDGNCLHCIRGNDRSTLLNAIYELLIEGGVFVASSVVAVSNDNYESSTITDDDLSRSFVSVTTLENELKEAGFTICKSETRNRETHGHYFGILKK